MEITYELVNDEVFYDYFDKNRSKYFEKEFDFASHRAYSDEEIEKQKAIRNDNPFTGFEYFILAKDGDKIVGHCFGIEKTPQEIYMVNSAVLPEYRRHGIYNTMLEMSVKLAKEKGFQVIYSLHKATNNPIIIPKLKFGFVITGLEYNDSFGILVKLSYYTNELRREFLDIRSGMIKLEEKHNKYIL